MKTMLALTATVCVLGLGLMNDRAAAEEPGDPPATALVDCSSTQWVCSSLDGTTQVCCSYDQQCQTYGDSGAYCIP